MKTWKFFVVLALLMTSVSAMAESASLGNEEEAENAAESRLSLRFMEWNYYSPIKSDYAQWSAGGSMLGSFREAEDDVILWQLNGSTGKLSDSSGSAGLIYRWANEDTAMFGVNAFLDYENRDLGDFTRWSFGGEVRTKWIDFIGNRYIGIKDTSYFEDGIAYISDGLDLGMAFYVPNMQWLSGDIAYYLREGRFGVSDSKDVIYSLRMRREIAENVLLGLNVSHHDYDGYYDRDDTSLGGSISYAHRLENSQTAICFRLFGTAIGDFAPSFSGGISYIYDFQYPKSRACAEERPHSFNPRNDFFLRAPRTRFTSLTSIHFL